MQLSTFQAILQAFGGIQSQNQRMLASAVVCERFAREIRHGTAQDD